MDSKELLLASGSIIARNIDSHVLAVTVALDSSSSKLTLAYYLDRYPVDDDKELCELALTELIAEFSEIASAASECLFLRDSNEANLLEGLVYVRH